MSLASRLTRTPLPLDPARGADVVARYGDFPPEIRGVIAGTAGCSPYLAGLLEREADWARAALSGPVEAAFDAEIARLQGIELEALGAELRRAKRRLALLIALADLGGVWALEQVTGALTTLADTAVDLALRRLVADEIRRGKLPGKGPDDAARAGGMVALAMGKMGAHELNYSSDIDLICLFDETQFAPDDRMEARAAFIRVTRKMSALINDITAEGYVFRTDLRLRPDASVTPVCISMGAAELYYEAEGRTWERAAYIKARPCAGDIAAGEKFLRALTPFVWRKHLDFAAIQDAHDMRLRIRAHKGLGGAIEVAGHNLKLGQGGIREIEFFTQTRQLIAGGRDAELRDRTTLGGLAKLAAKGWVPADVACELADHYREHREIEHRIQMVNDAQTQLMPTTPEGIDRIARLMGAGDTAAWTARLKDRLTRVEALTGAFFAPAEAAARPDLSPEAEAIVGAWTRYPALRSDRAQAIFRRIEPEILKRMERAASPEEALRQFDGFLARLPAGVQLFSLFEANPSLIDLIVDICATAPGLAAHLSRNPGVFDAVIGGSFFAAWPGAEALAESFRTTLAAVPDYEKKLDAARRWAKEFRFRVGVHHLRGLIDAAEAARFYADIAGTAVTGLWPEVVAEFARRHGSQPGRGAVVLGMGSLGAERLNAASDLDLIIIYDALGVEQSEGPKPLATRQYFARLTQAFITALTAPMPEGRLYEVDMRLRPSGRGGPVAVSLDSFRDYQRTEAWTWEHLALTRARVLAGDAGLGADVEAARLAVLAEKGGDPKVMPDLAEMRARIFAAKAPDGAWEAKIGPGRLQDIELLAQSFALRAGEPARKVEAQLRIGPRRGFVTKAEGELLASAYRFLWRLQAGGRLLTDRPLDLQALGEGGRAFLLRELGGDSLDALAERLARTTSEVAALVEKALG
ncbi:[protein-PII] uridylyltransferase family protein [Rhodobacter capsulatus]|uniref:[protein-PII] uridylyltransferase family protein n=1 Tax=Rhodobacter capsulatus TaxID=1061 RepID=UPI0003D39F0B|nr:glutamine-synthetase adenylyltransferase [Rhodobacter capsulatus]ETD80001.1 glutamate-ammonia ligase adenylyltransferase [Rhodobacter capsulatus B6]